MCRGAGVLTFFVCVFGGRGVNRLEKSSGETGIIIFVAHENVYPFPQHAPNNNSKPLMKYIHFKLFINMNIGGHRYDLLFPPVQIDQQSLI